MDENGDCVIKQGTASFIQYMEDDKWAIITSGQFFAYEDGSSTYKFSKGKFYLQQTEEGYFAEFKVTDQFKLYNDD